MNNKNTRKLLPLAIAALSAGLSGQASAASFELGPFEGNFTSNLSVGASWRMDDPDKGVLSPGNTNGRGTASSSTTDDGNLNYDKGDMFSLLFKGVHDLDLNAGNWGFYTSLKYWYDYELAKGKVAHGHAANGYEPDSELDMSDFEDLAQDKGFEFLDYYAYASFQLGDMPLELRAGNMVLSWGESTFIQNGLNTINPFDVSAIRKPGSEIKEALLPVGLVYGNIGLTYDLSIEAFVQYDWERTVLDEGGTYWSSADPYCGGCDYLTISTAIADKDAEAAGLILPKLRDVEADDSGQWGINARYFVEALNATEFGLYYMNLHSRTPILSVQNATNAFGLPVNFGADPAFFFEFPEDVEVWGATFATNIGDWAWSGELSYRPEYPLQINTTDILQAVALGTGAEWARFLPRSLEAGPGAILQGYDEVEYTQVQMTFIKFFEQVLGASRLSFASEIGGAWIGGMEDGINYGRSPAYGVGDFEPFASNFPLWPGSPVACNPPPAPAAFAGIVPNPNNDYCTDDGFTDDFSWGYRVRASLDYDDAFMGVNLTPSVAWSHDVSGNAEPVFLEDRMALSLGIQANYLNVYRADLSYTTFFNADYDVQQDRDFLALSFSVAF